MKAGSMEALIGACQNMKLVSTPMRVYKEAENMYPTINMKASGKKLGKIMKSKHLSVKQVQEYLGLSCVQSIYHWLNGISMPTIDNLYALSALFQVPIDEMICGTRDSDLYKFDDSCYRRMKEYYNKLQNYMAA